MRRTDLGFLPASVDVAPPARSDSASSPLAKPGALDGRRGTPVLRVSDPGRSYGLAFGETVMLTDAPERPDGELTGPLDLDDPHKSSSVRDAASESWLGRWSNSSTRLARRHGTRDDGNVAVLLFRVPLDV